MIFSNYHTHTTFCDGHHSPEEVILEAISLGMRSIGLSEHEYIPFDIENGMLPEKADEYFETVNALKEKYKDRIRVLCGAERDLFCPPLRHGYDYVIGSVHYVEQDGIYTVVDWRPEMFEKGVNELFGGDVYAFCEKYYEQESTVVEKTDCDIIGHFDLVTKFTEEGIVIDEEAPRYRNAVLKALDRLIPEDRIFEINTGAISRGHRKTPYPSPWILKEIARRGGRIIISADSHDKSTLTCSFDDAYELAKSCGFTSVENESFLC